METPILVIKTLPIIPTGWLLEPHGKCMLLFQKDKKSLNYLPMVFTEKWSVSPCNTPLDFINRRQVSIDAAVETWNELNGKGWIMLDFKNTSQ